ncbi:MAG TPA: rhodanese-like domain-containing protein, partial [Verrucomicrobiae bacterium]
DLRSKAEVERNPLLIRGARHLTMDELKSHQNEIPRDRDIILYCSCPNEVSSARMALLLQRHGFVHVRPLLGGIDAWRERNYPVELRAVVANLPSAASTMGEPTPAVTTKKTST